MMCITCGAAEGQPCVTPRGRLALKQHAARGRGHVRTPQWLEWNRTYQRERQRRLRQTKSTAA